MASRHYDISVTPEGANIIWRIQRYVSSDKTVFLHGRNYEELFFSNDMGRDLSRSFSNIGIGATKTGRTVKSHIDLMPIKLNQTTSLFFEKNEFISQTIENAEKGSFLLASTETFITRTMEYFPQYRPYYQFIEKQCRDIRTRLFGSDSLISFHEIEDTFFSAILINCIRNAFGATNVVLGPSRYKRMIKGRHIPRPQISERDFLKAYARATESTFSDSSRHFDQWSSLSSNPTVIRGGLSKRRHLTREDIDRFVRWTPDGPDEKLQDDIPSQVPGPINVVVSGGVLKHVEQVVETNAPTPSVLSSIKHLINIIDDIYDSAHLDNWSPSAREKMSRLYDASKNMSKGGSIPHDDMMAFSLDGNALKHEYEAYKDELSPQAQAAFAPLFVHISLISGQFPAWKEFTNAAQSINWGIDFSESYLGALKGVAVGLQNMPAQLAEPEVLSSIADSVHQIDKSTPLARTKATFTVRNILSAMFSFFARTGRKISTDAAVAVGGKISDSAADALWNVAIGLKDRFLVLADSNPQLFGWIRQFIETHAGK